MNLERKLQIALDVVGKACLISRKIQREFATQFAMIKQDRSPVTLADYAVQIMITKMLADEYPDIPMLAEESLSELLSSENKELIEKVISEVKLVLPGITREEIFSGSRVISQRAGSINWVLDPIDGTKGFLRGDQYAIALALLVEGVIVLGVLGCPNLSPRNEKFSKLKGCVLSAQRGCGAKVHSIDIKENYTLHVNSIDSPKNLVFCESVEKSHTNHSQIERIRHRLNVVPPSFRIDSQCKYASVALGDASVYLRYPSSKEYKEKIWDHAAGAIILEEAGGKVSDIFGVPLDFSAGHLLGKNTGILATNKQYHEDVVSASFEIFREFASD